MESNDCINNAPGQCSKDVFFKNTCSSKLGLIETPSCNQNSINFNSTRYTPFSRLFASLATTPHSVSTGAASSPSILSIVEGRGMASGEIGFACLDLRSSEITLSQFPDSKSYERLNSSFQIFTPFHVLLPSTVVEKNTQLFKFLKENFPSLHFETVARKYFREANGLDLLRKLCSPDFKSVEVQVHSKYYCLAALAALIKYVEFHENIIFSAKSVKFVFTVGNILMILEAGTIRCLEVLGNLKDHKSNHCLFGALNFTNTTAGQRRLRSNLLMPSIHKPTILQRHAVIDELLTKKEILGSLCTLISRFQGFDCAIGAWTARSQARSSKTAERAISALFKLRQCLELLGALRNILSSLTSTMIIAATKILADERVNTLLSVLQELISPDVQYANATGQQVRSNHVFCIRSGKNGLLDVSRCVYTEQINEINKLASNLSEKYGIPLRLCFNISRGGFYLHFSSRNMNKPDNFPSEAVKVQHSKSSITFTTNSLMRLNEQHARCVDGIFISTEQILRDKLSEVQKEFGCLFLISDCISLLDFLTCLAIVSKQPGFTKPVFTADTLAIQEAYHPILRRFFQDTCIPNDIYITSRTNALILTGPNMSGKSTYLKQVACLQIMGQLGCYLPARYAAIPIFVKIVACIGGPEREMEHNTSSLANEMKEISLVLDNISSDNEDEVNAKSDLSKCENEGDVDAFEKAILSVDNAQATSSTKDSFVTQKMLLVVDELGRSTSYEEGTGLCFAICEYLLQREIFTIFATHFLEVTQLARIYPNCESIQLTVKIDSFNNIQYERKLNEGATQVQLYGLRLAKQFPFPSSIIQWAYEHASKIKSQLLPAPTPNHEDESAIATLYRLGCLVHQEIFNGGTIPNEVTPELIQRLKTLQDSIKPY